MSDGGSLVSWLRPHFEPGGGDAHLFFKVHGRFAGSELVADVAEYRSAGLPHGCDLQLYTRQANPEQVQFGLGDDLFGRQLREDPAHYEAVAAADQCIILRGEIPDPRTLDYLRDVVGLITALLDHGGLAVFDAHQFHWWRAEEWREQLFAPAAPVPRRHVVILVSDEPDSDRRWYHTRGMRKFGRPDLSVHDVPPALWPAVEDLCNRFIAFQALGAVIPEGQEIRVPTLPAGWRCRHRGDLEDPDFNNRHIEIGPAPEDVD